MRIWRLRNEHIIINNILQFKEQEEKFKERLKLEQEKLITVINTTSSRNDDPTGTLQRIKELHRLVAEQDKTISEMKTQADENINRINVSKAAF